MRVVSSITPTPGAFRPEAAFGSCPMSDAGAAMPADLLGALSFLDLGSAAGADPARCRVAEIFHRSVGPQKMRPLAFSSEKTRCV